MLCRIKVFISIKTVFFRVGIGCSSVQLAERSGSIQVLGEREFFTIDTIIL